MKKHRRQIYFTRRDLQISLTLIVIWSFITAIFFIFVIKEAKEFIEAYELGDSTKLAIIILVFVGYVVALALLTTIFTHRFIGPFPRLSRELREITEGKYEKRLSIRKMDDLYIRSFIEDINRVLDVLEQRSSAKR